MFSSQQRLGFRIKDFREVTIDYCPVCRLQVCFKILSMQNCIELNSLDLYSIFIQCTCAKCTKDLGKAALNFKKECDLQQMEPKCVVIENVLSIASGTSGNAQRSIIKSKPKVTKKSRHVKHTLPKSKRQKLVKQIQPPPPEDVVKKIVKKVPREEFPSEVCDGINYDPSHEDDYRTIFTPEGSRLSSIPPLKVEEPSTPEEETNDDLYDNVDGNFDVCSICNKGGDLICCDFCPRSFKADCLNLSKSELPKRWECPKCIKDGEVQEGDHIENSTNFNKLASLYRELEKDEKEPNMFKPKVTIVSIAVDIINRLKNYDFGDVFAVPVNPEEVPDYLTVIKTPMDLGTIETNIINGVYLKKLTHLDCNGCSKMERIALEVLKDIELVWHNCWLYNAKGKFILHWLHIGAYIFLFLTTFFQLLRK